MAATRLLLLEDVDNLGRSGDLVSVRGGYARNFLMPRGVAVVANKGALRMQERLQEERKTKAVADKKEAEQLASKFQDLSLTIIVKVDPEGHMYGSVSAHDIVHKLAEEQKIEIEKKSVQLKHPIKVLGSHTITLKLNEGVTASIGLNIVSELGDTGAQLEHPEV